MMNIQTFDAVFENGVFRPVAAPAEIVEGQRVRLIMEPADGNVMDLASQVYQGLTDEQVDDIEQIALDRKPFFERADR